MRLVEPTYVLFFAHTVKQVLCNIRLDAKKPDTGDTAADFIFASKMIVQR